MDKNLISKLFFRRCKVKLIGPLQEIEVEGVLDPTACISLVDNKLIEQIGFKANETAPQVVIQLVDSPITLSMNQKDTETTGEGRKINLTLHAHYNSPLPLMLGLDFLLEAMNDLPLCIEEFSRLYKFIQKVRMGCVLIIGNDSNEECLGILREIQYKLKKLNYEGILLKDYPDIYEQSIEEKLTLFGCISKFVICENSFPSGHIDELSICARNRLVTVVMQQIGKYTSWLQECYPVDFNFIKKVEYTAESIDNKINEAVKIAEVLVIERKRALNRIYKYRNEWLKRLSNSE